MLVANPGHTPYSLISKKSCNNKPARNNAVTGSSVKFTPTKFATTLPSTSTIITNTMTAVATAHSNNEINNLKTLSVRISRDTDLLKHTVQKSLISKIPSSHFSSFLNLCTVPPTNTHQFPERVESQSVDSLRTEMCHFKPIRTVPTTPTKRARAVILKVPKAKLASKVEGDSEEGERSMLSSNLTGSIFLESSRISAFSNVANSEQLLIHSESSHKHKTKSKVVNASNKTHQENYLLEKDCIQPRVILKHMTSFLSDGKLKESSSANLLRKRTRRSTIVSAMASGVEQQQISQSLMEVKVRVTRKIQQITRNETSVAKKKAKLFKDCNIKNMNNDKGTGRRRPSRRTPPVTRSRLKQSMVLTRKQYQNM